MTRRTLAAIALAICIPSIAAADRPIGMVHPMVDPTRPPPASLISHILYLNNCQPSGCKVTQGPTDSRTDHSDISMVGQGTLTPYLSGNLWNQVKSCITTVMAPFNITVTDVDPGNVDHFEIMIAGDPGQLGLPTSVAGIADYTCQSPGSCFGAYIDNALVFDFAGSWGNDVTGLCGTAAQEIAHAWTIDHATPASDPMTYNNYSSPLSFRDNAVCGSDCLYSCPSGGGTCNAFGVTCSNNTHPCMESGTATQNEVTIIKNLFGPAGTAAPVVKITSPSNGGTVTSGMAFQVTATCDTGDGIAEVDLEIDNAPIATLTTSPATFTGPSNLKDGSHNITVACGTQKHASASASIDVIVGTKCSADTDCMANFICYESACIAGPMANGGLGATCTSNTDCVSGACASDGTTMSCVVPCDPNNDQCPGGFGCLMAGAGGVCWAGAAHGSAGGCCDASDRGAPGSILFGLGIFALLITKRRR